MEDDFAALPHAKEMSSTAVDVAATRATLTSRGTMLAEETFRRGAPRAEAMRVHTARPKPFRNFFCGGLSNKDRIWTSGGGAVNAPAASCSCW